MTRRDVLLSSFALAGAPAASLLRPLYVAAEAPVPGLGSVPTHQPRETAMYLVRDVFQCKPGKARALADTFQKASQVMRESGGPRNGRILVDYVAHYWTVVLESEVDDLAEFEQGMEQYASRPEIRQAMEGYMDLVESGHREIYRILYAE